MEKISQRNQKKYAKHDVTLTNIVNETISFVLIHCAKRFGLNRRNKSSIGFYLLLSSAVVFDCEMKSFHFSTVFQMDQ